MWKRWDNAVAIPCPLAFRPRVSVVPVPRRRMAAGNDREAPVALGRDSSKGRALRHIGAEARTTPGWMWQQPKKAPPWHGTATRRPLATGRSDAKNTTLRTTPKRPPNPRRSAARVRVAATRPGTAPGPGHESCHGVNRRIGGSTV